MKNFKKPNGRKIFIGFMATVTTIALLVFFGFSIKGLAESKEKHDAEVTEDINGDINRKVEEGDTYLLAILDKDGYHTETVSVTNLKAGDIYGVYRCKYTLSDGRRVDISSGIVMIIYTDGTVSTYTDGYMQVVK